MPKGMAIGITLVLVGITLMVLMNIPKLFEPGGLMEKRELCHSKGGFWDSHNVCLKKIEL